MEGEAGEVEEGLDEPVPRGAAQLGGGRDGVHLLCMVGTRASSHDKIAWHVTSLDLPGDFGPSET